MDKYRKNSSKLLPPIYNDNNRVVLYTQYDTFCDVGDKLYISVFDTNSLEYIYLDSVNNTTKYEILNKNGNRITLDIKYDELITNLGISSSDVPKLSGNCYISRIILNDSIFNSGTINSCIISNITIQPISKNKVIWKQGIILNSIKEIINIDFNPKNNDEYLVLTSEFKNNKINNYFTKNKKNNSLSLINIENTEYLNITDCNINTGYYDKCIFDTTNVSHSLTNCYINNSSLGGVYTINGGYYKNCSFLTYDVIWNYGIWDNYNTSIEFKAAEWNDGIWKQGSLSNITKWINGTFNDGIFNGNSWINGTFNGGTFTNSTWNSGTFNGGTFTNSTWDSGTFNGGTFTNSTWYIGIFNDGTFTNSTWNNEILSDGVLIPAPIEYSIFNNGKFTNESLWYNGIFNSGTFTDNSTWYSGKFYNGIFTNNSTWYSGKFYNGNFNTSSWKDGVVYYGIFNDVVWDNGTFNNGIMNNSKINSIIWNNGITNNSKFGISEDSIISWKNGSFNSGTFGWEQYDGVNNTKYIYLWYGGIFYSGDFYGKSWVDGVMYTGYDPNDKIDSKFKLDKIFEPYKT